MIITEIEYYDVKPWTNIIECIDTAKEGRQYTTRKTSSPSPKEPSPQRLCQQL